MKVIFNHQIIDDESLCINYKTRNYFSGDWVNSFCWFIQTKLLFWEEAYFQLMASMRKMRMNIPASFTPELFEEETRLLLQELQISQGTLKITVFRTSESEVSYIMEILPYKDFYAQKENELDIYKEAGIFPDIFSSIYIFHPLNLIAQQYAKENDLQELIILNHDKKVARSISGNIFMIQDNIIYSNSEKDGAYISALKKKFISFLREKTEYIYKEESFSSYQTQSANEILILSDEKGIIPITKIRKTTFATEQTQLLAKKFIGYAIASR